MKFQNQEKIGNMQKLLNRHYNNGLKQHFKVSYHCSCSKVYESYSALYFHVREKHKVKLNAQISQPYVKVNIYNQTCHIMYDVEKIRQKQQDLWKQLIQQKQRCLRSKQKTKAIIQQSLSNQSSIQNNIHSAISGFCKAIKTKKLDNISQIQTIFQIFKKFIIQQIKQHFPQAQNKKSGKVLKLTCCENLPTYFNKFLCSYFPKVASKEQDFQLAIDLLYDFANWLKENQLTSITLEKNDDFIA